MLTLDRAGYRRTNVRCLRENQLRRRPCRLHRRKVDRQSPVQSESANRMRRIDLWYRWRADICNERWILRRSHSRHTVAWSKADRDTCLDKYLVYRETRPVNLDLVHNRSAEYLQG